jgi:hypothetical protein
MTSLSNDKVPKELKIIALLLIGGGIFGIVMIFSEGLQTLSHQSVSVDLFCASVFAAVFGLCVLVGVRLWGGKPGGVRWAKLLFAAQIPILSIPHYFAYEFYSGLTIRLMLEQIDTFLDLGISFYFGAGLQFIISPEIQNLTLGINLLAFIVFLYLVKASRLSSKPVVVSNIPLENDVIEDGLKRDA